MEGGYREVGKVLVVDDEEAIVELIKFNLQKEGHQVITACDGGKALELAETQEPDVIILDVMLPGRDGFEVCRLLRARQGTAAIPIILLTAKGEEFDKVLGLELGADDYVTKPFSPRELTARVKARLRSRNMAGQVMDKEGAAEIRAGAIVMRPDHYQVLLHGESIDLTPKEFELLRHLMQSPGKVLKRDYLLDQVWGYDFAADTRTVDVHIRYLRQKIEQDPANPKFIETVRGVGYRFREQE